MINESELMQGRPVMNDIEADEMLAEIREFEAEKNRFEMIANAKIDNIKQELDRKTTSLDNQIQFMKDQLRAYFLTVPAKETKTQKSYSLLSGKLVMKKSKDTFDYDKDKLLEAAKKDDALKEFIKTKEEFNWGEFKKNLAIKDGSIVNSNTGELLGIEGLTIKECPEEFQIKY